MDTATHAHSLAQVCRLTDAGGENKSLPSERPMTFREVKPRDLRLMRLLMEGRTMDEAAYAEGMPRNTANVRLTRARDRLGLRSLIQWAALLGAEEEREKYAK